MTRFHFWVTWLWLLALSILATIYLAWAIYPLEIDWLKLMDQVTISRAALLSNVHHLLDYLTNPFHQQLAMPDFPSSPSGLKHFADVKGLFHLTQFIFLLLAFPACRFFKRMKERKFRGLFKRQAIFALLLPLFIALLSALIGFDQFFTLFHQVLFPGDSSWLFNPATDPIIWVLPESFFLHCFVLFLLLYESVMGILCFWMSKA